MLVLSRKKNESIVINDNITIVVVEIRGDKVRLGVEAPKEVPVHRREVYDAIQHVLTTAKESGIRAGLHCMAPDYIKKMYDCGFDFASLSNDVRLLTQVVTSQINAVRS